MRCMTDRKYGHSPMVREGRGFESAIDGTSIPQEPLVHTESLTVHIQNVLERVVKGSSFFQREEMILRVIMGFLKRRLSAIVHVLQPTCTFIG